MNRIYYGWFVVSACFSIAFYVSGAVVDGFTAFFEPIAEDFGWSYTQISIAASLRGMELGIFAPIMGILVDRFGARKMLFFGTLSMGVAFMLLSRMNSLTMFYVAFVIMGIGTSACTGVALIPAVASWFKKNLGKALGIVASGHGMGGLLIPVITLLIGVYHWRATFMILGLGMWIIGIPLSLLVQQDPGKYGYLIDGIKQDKAVSSSQPRETQRGLKEAFRTRIFWHISISEALRLMVSTAVATHIMPYLSTLEMPRSKAALVATCIPVFSIIGRMGCGWLSDKFGRLYVMAGAYALSGIGLVALAYVGAAGFIFPFLLLYPLAWGAGPVRAALFRDYFGTASLGTITGMMAGIGTLARIIGPTLAGWTYDTFGRYQPIWLIYAGTAAMSVALMLTPSIRKTE